MRVIKYKVVIFGLFMIQQLSTQVNLPFQPAFTNSRDLNTCTDPDPYPYLDCWHDPDQFKWAKLAALYLDLAVPNPCSCRLIVRDTHHGGAVYRVVGWPASPAQLGNHLIQADS